MTLVVMRVVFVSAGTRIDAVGSWIWQRFFQKFGRHGYFFKISSS